MRPFKRSRAGWAPLLFSSMRPVMSISCPCCQSDHIHRSMPRGILERILAIISLRPYRCEDCDYRFFRFSAKSRPARLMRTS